MRKFFVFVAIGVSIQGGLVAGGCSEVSQPVGDSDPVVRGSLRMQLTATSDSGKVYRLRQAVMPVNSFFGGGTVTLNSESDPTKQVLETFLNPGSYQIQLVDGWFIEQVDELLGTAFPVSANLLSSPFQFFDIFSNQETFVKFEFDVDGTRITFGPPGRLIVGIGVHEVNGNAVCGNGVMEGGESCDGFDLGGQNCASVTLGTLPGGFLLCSPFCSFDVSFCTPGDGGVGGVGGGFGGFGGTFDGGVGGFGGTFDGGRGGFIGSGGATPVDGGPSPATGGVTSDGGASAGGASTGGRGNSAGRGGRG